MAPSVATDEPYTADISQDEVSDADEEDEEEVITPFRFFDLPSELRIRIYEEVLIVPRPVDLDPSNYRKITPRLEIFEVCHRMHNEAYPIFYGSNTFRLFPISGKFFNTKQPLLARLPKKYRSEITSLELRLGPGWSKPPRCWTLNPRPRYNLRLHDCVKIRELKIFVEVDPSHDIFKGYRIDGSFYTKFCGELLSGLLMKVPTIKRIQFDAYPSVSKNGFLMRELLTQAKIAEKTIIWGAASWKQSSAPSAGGIQHDMETPEVVELVLLPSGNPF